MNAFTAILDTHMNRQDSISEANKWSMTSNLLLGVERSTGQSIVIKNRN
jgi:hypothetical protein